VATSSSAWGRGGPGRSGFSETGVTEMDNWWAPLVGIAVSVLVIAAGVKWLVF
jgi:hypothetical protein